MLGILTRFSCEQCFHTNVFVVFVYLTGNGHFLSSVRSAFTLTTNTRSHSNSNSSQPLPETNFTQCAHAEHVLVECIVEKCPDEEDNVFFENQQSHAMRPIDTHNLVVVDKDGDIKVELLHTEL